MRVFRVILLGLGFWGSKWMQTLSMTKNCQIVAMTGSKEDIERISKQYGVSKNKAYTDYKKAIKKTAADIVIIAIPTKYHIIAARLALEKGMHVLSEKPLASNWAEAKEIIKFREKYPAQKYMIDQNYRWRPHNQTIMKAIEKGMIGEIGAINIEFRQPENLLGYREFLKMPLLQDVSIHHFDLIRFFTGKRCKEIFAYSYRPSWSKFTGIPSTEGIIKMEGGIIVNYNATWAARGRETSWDGNITITGERGCLTLDSSDNVRFFGPADREGRVLKKISMQYLELDYALHMFMRCIEEDTTPETTVEDNCHSFAMVCAAEESVKKQIVIEL